jgi:hypothetical protein
MVTTDGGVRHWVCNIGGALLAANTTRFPWGEDMHIEAPCEGPCDTKIVLDIENGTVVSKSPDEVYVIFGVMQTGLCYDNILTCGTCKDEVAAQYPGVPVLTIEAALTMAINGDPWTQIGAVPGDLSTYAPIPEEKMIVEKYTAILNVAEPSSWEEAVASASSKADQAATTASGAATTAADASSKADQSVNMVNNSSTLTYVAIGVAALAVVLSIVAMIRRPK